jgi:hypothetical protein
MRLQIPRLSHEASGKRQWRALNTILRSQVTRPATIIAVPVWARESASLAVAVIAVATGARLLPKSISAAITVAPTALRAQTLWPATVIAVAPPEQARPKIPITAGFVWSEIPSAETVSVAVTVDTEALVARS